MCTLEDLGDFSAFERLYRHPTKSVSVARRWPEARLGLSLMKDRHNPALPWQYPEEARKYLRPSDAVMDIGTGGGERFIELAPYFGSGLGIDIDPKMVSTAGHNAAGVARVAFAVMDDGLEGLDRRFDVILGPPRPLRRARGEGATVPGRLFRHPAGGGAEHAEREGGPGQPVVEPTLTAGARRCGLRVLGVQRVQRGARHGGHRVIRVLGWRRPTSPTRTCPVARPWRTPAPAL